MSDYEFNGEHYRDDRMFVLYLCKCTEEIQGDYIRTSTYHENPPEDAKWCIVTYRNVERYPPTRTDVFETKQLAEQYMKCIEPTIPLVSLGGHPRNPPLEYDEFAKWKSDQGFGEYDYKLTLWPGMVGGGETILRKREIDIMPQEQSHEEMSALFMKAERGDAIAQYTIGSMYGAGNVVPEDYAEAMRWTRLAAEQGHVMAQGFLGVIYCGIEGVVPEDYAEAMRWTRLAAEQGFALAQYQLGAMHVNGLGVPKDSVIGYAWLMVAASNGDDLDKNHKSVIRNLGERMTEEQIAEAQKISSKILKGIEANTDN